MSGDDPLKHKPFSALRAVSAVPRAAGPVPGPKEQPLGRLIVREEFDTAAGAPIARVLGVAGERLGALGKQVREALGLAVMIEGRELLVMRDDCERVATWLREAGASEVVIVRRPAEPGVSGGTVRADIRRGTRVAIVMKGDQASGALTEGVVRDILTSAPTHPRGIKVRLETGQVGRVRRILG